MKQIEFHIHNKDIESLRTYLSETLDYNSLGIHALIGVVRATCRVRTLIPEWETMYQRIRELVRELGHDPDKIFVGIKLFGPIEDKIMNNGS